ncbi:MAG: hypothetical protein WAK60_00185 [Sedimentisphaerales bacterium]
MPRMGYEEEEKMKLMTGNFCGRIKFFDEFHGDCVVIGNWIFYEDGAMRERSVGFSTPLMEPPENERECAKNILVFTEAKLQLAREEFDNFKNQLKQRCQLIAEQGDCNNPLSPPSTEDIQKLENLKIKVMSWQKRLKKTRKDFEATTPAYVKKRAKRCGENRSKTIDVAVAIEKIEV